MGTTHAKTAEMHVGLLTLPDGGTVPYRPKHAAG
jgi:hypothetical protein